MVGQYYAMWVNVEHGFMQWPLGYSIDGESLHELVQRLLMLRSFLCLVVMVGESSCEGYLPVLDSWRAAQLSSALDVTTGHMVVAFYEIIPESWLQQIWRMSQ